MIDNRRKAPDSFMPLWIADYLADTGHLTTEQDGAFLLLLMGYWRRKCVGLPDDDTFLCQLTKLSKHKWRHVRPIIGAFFEIRDGLWRNKRADQEWAYATKLKAAKSAAGAKGAEVTNAKRAGRASYVPPTAGAKSYENSQGGDVVMSPQILEGGIGTQTAEFSQVNHGTADAVLSANGSANAQPTPTPLQRKKDSEANASEPDGSAVPVIELIVPQKEQDDPAPPSAAVSAIDLEAQVWAVGKTYLIEHGASKTQAGALIGKWRKRMGGDDLEVMRLLRRAQAECVSEPVSFIEGCIKHQLSQKGKSNGRANGQSRSVVFDDAFDAYVGARAEHAAPRH